MIVVPACTVVVAPRKGRVRRLAAQGSTVTSGDPVAQVDAGGSVTTILAPASGRVGGALAAEGQSVLAGEGVVWLAR